MGQGFRGDIQGLRAVAVLTVIAGHAGVPFLPGGFVGVDVFFVISGYLISSLLFREVLGSGRFSLAGFWARRARRILPAATLVTVVTVIASMAVLSLIDARQVVTDALWSALFAANFRFAHQDISYFDQGSGVSPLQHYWSLAVEEQFYVVWPLLLLLCLGLVRLARRGRPDQRRLPRRVVFLMLVAVTAGSFVWSVAQTASEPASAYFSTFTRAWELGLGALVALASPALLRRIGRRTGSAMAVLGLGAIVAASIGFTSHTPFPGYAAALPVVGAALLLLAGAGATAPVTWPLLDNPLMRRIGDWSYSLYLWHWPALILTERALARSLTPLETLAAVAGAVGLSYLTYRFVETPFRNGRPAKALRVPRALVLYPATAAVVAVTCVGGWYWTGYQGGEHGDNPPIAVAVSADDEDHHEGAVDLVRASVDAARNDMAVPSDLTPNLLQIRDSIADVGECDYTEDVRQLCLRGDEDGSRTVVLIGDSHARAWIPAFDGITERAGWRAYYLVKPQCTAAHVTVAPLDDNRPFTECDDFQDWVIDQVTALDPDLVVVSSSPPVNGVYDGDQRFEDTDAVAGLLASGYDDLFSTLRESAERVVLLRDVPKSADDPGTCLSQRDPSLRDCMFEPEERSRILADVAVASARAAGAEVVDPTPWLCYQGDCPVVIGGTLSYRDTDHLTAEYAASLADPLGAALDMFDD
jgi:peptidoglycan/LPS O-acetylase OafA/YrhL